MFKTIIFSIFTSLCFGAVELPPLCQGGTPESYDPNFQIGCPAQGSDSYVPVKFGCSPEGKGISPPISWKGIPKTATHLRVIVEDATCGYGCDECCKFHHWVLDFPLAELKGKKFVSEKGVVEGASKEAELMPFTLPNGAKKASYFPFCPPKIQTHAYIFHAIAYRIEDGNPVIVARSMSKPLLFSLTAERN
jgi:phosphatidylethanolamine-binding protein (PEBP) family uncharacterized protein